MDIIHNFRSIVWTLAGTLALLLLTIVSCHSLKPQPVPSPEPSHKVWSVKMFGKEILRSETTKEEHPLPGK